MSNPLIRPSDPRFQRPPITDETGINRFSEDEPIQAQPADMPATEESAFAAPQSSDERAYQPEYATGQPSRHRLIQTLSASALTAVSVAALTLWIEHWTVYPMLLIALPTAILNWYVAADELSVIRRGGVNADHRTVARLGLAVGIACTLSAIGILFTAIQKGIELGG